MELSLRAIGRIMRMTPERVRDWEQDPAKEEPRLEAVYAKLEGVFELASREAR